MCIDLFSQVSYDNEKIETWLDEDGYSIESLEPPTGDAVV